MQRGITIFNQLTFDDVQVIEAPKPQNCSRDAQLIANRNNFLFHRFYYKSKVQRKLYNDCLKELSEEVYLSKITLQKLIQANGESILLIKKMAPEKGSQKYFKDKFPHIVWD